MRAEQSKLRTAERLVNLLAMFCILSWRIFWLTMINRVVEQLSPKSHSRPWKLICCTDSHTDDDDPHCNSARLPDPTRNLVATRRAGDGPPGNMVMCAHDAMTDIELGFQLGSQNVVIESGNQPITARRACRSASSLVTQELWYLYITDRI